MGEYALRPDPRLGAIALSRLRTALALVAGARLARFRLGSLGPEASARRLEEVLASA
jgi:hypothetical protein